MLRFLTGDVADGNGEIVRRTLAAVRVQPDGRIEPAPAASLFDVVPPADQIHPPPEDSLPAAPQTDSDLVMWARQHVFERVFQEAKAEREHVAAIQEDFLKRSFNSLLAQADAAIIAAEEEIDRGIQGAEGRLRKSELVKEQHQQRSRLRLEETLRGSDVARGDVTVIGSALLLPLPTPAEGEEPGSRATGGGAPTRRLSRSPWGSPAGMRPAAAPRCGPLRTIMSDSIYCPPAASNAAVSSTCRIEMSHQ